MARATMSELLEKLESVQEKLEAMQEEIDALRAHIDSSAASAVQYVYELRRPAPVSDPLDFAELTARAAWLHSHYDEATDWGATAYI